MWEFRYTDELYHYGIKGQKWGVRRFQNPDGTLTAEGKKRLSGNKSVMIEKGATFHRLGSSDDDSKKNKGMYVLADKEEQDKFVSSMIGIGHALAEKGKAYATKYEMDTDLIIPSERKQNKMALKVMKKGDDALINELRDTMASKGHPEQYIKKVVDRHSVGKEFLSSLGLTAGMAATSGALGFLAGGPIGGMIFGGGAIGTMLPLMPAMVSQAKGEKLRAFYESIGDDRNSETYKALKKMVNDKGYNAIRDLNDKNNSMKSNSALILMNPSQAHKVNTTEITKKEFSDAYIREYRKEHPSASREDTLSSIRKEAEKIYDKQKKKG